MDNRKIDIWKMTSDNDIWKMENIQHILVLAGFKIAYCKRGQF